MKRKLLITALIVTFAGMGHIIYEQQNMLEQVNNSNSRLFKNLVMCVNLYNRVISQ